MNDELPADRERPGTDGDPAGREGRVERGALRSPGWGKDEALTVEVGDRDPASFRESMVSRHHQHLGDVGQAMALDVVRERVGRDADVRRACADGVDRRAPVGGDDVEALGALSRERTHPIAEDEEESAGAGREDDARADLSASHPGEEVVRSLRDVTRKRGDVGSLTCEDQAPPRAAVERSADLLGKALELRVHGGLRQVKAARGAREARVLGEHGERAKGIRIEHSPSMIDDHE